MYFVWGVMRLPDFIVIGAQKSGTTALFKFLSEHPKIYLPPQKEVQYFSNDNFYSKGIKWCSHEFYNNVNENMMCGDVSPQYMIYKKVPLRIKKALPNAKIIVILREPIERAYSHYHMSVRRGNEKREFDEAFRVSVDKGYKDDESIIEDESYYQFSDYEVMLREYLKYFSKDKILVLFQEDLSKYPIETLNTVYDFIGVSNHFTPKNPNKRIHQGGVKRFPGLELWLNSSNVITSVIKPFVPTKWRAAFRFWIEQVNVKPAERKNMSKTFRKNMKWLTNKQVKFLKEEFNLDAPW